MSSSKSSVGKFFNLPALEYNSIEVPVVSCRKSKATNRRNTSMVYLIEFSVKINENSDTALLF